MQRRAGLVVITVLVLVRVSNAGSITEVPNLWTSGGLRQILQLMPDGRSIMGVEGREVFRWTASSSRVVVGELPPQSIVTAISGDGSTVVGRAVDWITTHSFRWTASGGVSILPEPDGFPYNSSPSHVSYDGNVIYGTAETVLSQPISDLWALGMVTNPDFPDIYPFPTVPTSGIFSWTAGAGTHVVADWALPHAFAQRKIAGLSSDGGVLGGTWDRKPVLWTAATGANDTALPPVPQYSLLQTLSADGTTIAGKSWSPDSLPFRWGAGHEIEFLTDVKGYNDVYAISADGNTILGYLDPDDGAPFTFVWQASLGMQSLSAYFAARGLSLPGENHSAIQMSADGLVFYGYTTDKTIMPDGTITYHTSNWIADLTTAIPEPTSLTQILTAFLLLLSAQYRRRR